MRTCKINFILSELEKHGRWQEGSKNKSRHTNYKALAVIKAKDSSLDYGNNRGNGEKWMNLENNLGIGPKELDDRLNVKG